MLRSHSDLGCDLDALVRLHVFRTGFALDMKGLMSVFGFTPSAMTPCLSGPAMKLVETRRKVTEYESNSATIVHNSLRYTELCIQ